MSGVGGIGGMAGMAGQNPLSGLGGSGMAQGGGGLSGLMGDDGGGLGGSGSSVGGAPNAQATTAQGSSFGDSLKSMLVDGPSASKASAADMISRFDAGAKIDPQEIAIASAKAGVEIQMSTRTISSAVSAVRTLFQMQI